MLAVFCSAPKSSSIGLHCRYCSHTSRTVTIDFSISRLGQTCFLGLFKVTREKIISYLVVRLPSESDGMHLAD